MGLFNNKPTITLQGKECRVVANYIGDIIVMTYAGMKALEESGFDMTPVLEALGKACQNKKEVIHERSAEY